MTTMQDSFARKQRQTDEPKRDEQFVRNFALSLDDKTVYDLFFKSGGIKSAGLSYFVVG